MRKFLLVSVSALTLGFAGAAYAANTGGSTAGGTASGSNAGNSSTASTASGSATTSNSGSDTTSQREACPGDMRSANCIKPQDRTTGAAPGMTGAAPKP